MCLPSHVLPTSWHLLHHFLISICITTLVIKGMDNPHWYQVRVKQVRVRFGLCQPYKTPKRVITGFPKIECWPDRQQVQQYLDIYRYYIVLSPHHRGSTTIKDLSSQKKYKEPNLHLVLHLIIYILTRCLHPLFLTLLMVHINTIQVSVSFKMVILSCTKRLRGLL